MTAIEETILSPVIGWLLLAIFGLAWIGLGYYWGRKARDLDGFMLAGRNVGLALGAATAMATWVTSNTIMLAPMFALQYGVLGMLAYSAAAFGLFLFAPLANRIRSLMPKGYTSGDFIRLRFGRTAWVIFLAISLFYSMAWLVSMAMAGGIVLNALAGIPYGYGMTVILAVCVLYTLFGGLYAVIGTDFIQSLIILLGVVVIGFVVLSRVSLGDVHANLEATQPALLNLLLPVALLTLLNSLFFGFGEVFHNNVWWSRGFAMREGVPFKAFLLAGLFWLPIPIAAGFIALCSGVLGINVVDINMAGPLIAGTIMGPVGAAIVFLVVFCSLGSSIDSLLAATSDLLTEDVYRKMLNPGASDGHLRAVAGVVIVGLGVVTWAICIGDVRNLIQVLFFAGPLVGSAIWPVIAGLFWRTASGWGACAAMVLGSVGGMLAFFQIGFYTGALVATLISCAVMVIATIVSKTTFRWELLSELPPEGKG